jgi:hypothetical protein
MVKLKIKLLISESEIIHNIFTKFWLSKRFVCPERQISEESFMFMCHAKYQWHCD